MKMQTYTGKVIDLQNPKVEDIDPIDIAHSLSMTCRFRGHTREFYSVAQHSVMCAEMVASFCALDALLHDAAEAYLCDFITPLKILIPAIYPLEDMFSRIIRIRFGLPEAMSEEVKSYVKDADNIMLATEIKDLTTNPDSEHWPELPEAPWSKSKLQSWGMKSAESMFLELLSILYKP